MVKKGYGKIKGGNFEREICKKLSLWVSEGKRDDIFWRSAMSGGRSTIGLKKGIKRSNQAGDITAIDPMGQFLINKFIIECKSYKNIQLQSMLFGIPKNNSIFEFWTELWDKANQFNKTMMLIIKYNGLPEEKTLMAINRTSKIDDFQLFLTECRINPIAEFLNVSPICYIYNFNEFLKTIDPESIKLLK